MFQKSLQNRGKNQESSSGESNSIILIKEGYIHLCYCNPSSMSLKYDLVMGDKNPTVRSEFHWQTGGSNGRE